MSAPFQAVPLVCAPSYPNSIVWSEENLIAVATGPIVTILNPEKPCNPRGVITLKPLKPFQIGVIDREDLVSDCMLPISLARDSDPTVRSISWSPVGFSPNSGCLLAVCSTDGRVKIYRQPYCEFQDEWIEVMDVSEMLLTFYANTRFEEPAVPSPTKSSDAISAYIEIAEFSHSIIQQGSLVEVLKVEGGMRVWVAGRVERLDDSKALVLYTEAGKEEWIEMDQRKNKRRKSDVGAAIADENDSLPKIRPAMDVDNLPEEILSADFEGALEILKIGRAVEAWTLDRWLEGLFEGYSNGSLLVKPHGTDDAVLLDASRVRLAPLWIRKKRLWQLDVIRLQRKEELAKVQKSKYGNVKDCNVAQNIPARRARRKPSECLQDDLNLQLITANVYVSRSASFSSLTVAWSPILCFSATSSDKSRTSYCLLAIGAKSGKVSVWRINEPQHYSVQHDNVSPCVMLVGLLQVHKGWVTTLCWGVSASDASHCKLLLATGSSDGSVKIWHGCAKDLEESTEANPAPFSLLKEVSAAGSAPVSLVSLIVPVQAPRKILVAVGRGSGSFELWTSDTEMKDIKQIGSCVADDHVVTGLAWAFDGRCLFTCSQDNAVRGHMLHKDSLVEVPIPSNNPCTRSSCDIPSGYDLCFGLVVSPANLMVAVVRNFDRHTLDPMYQARIQRGAVEFFWIAGQQLNILSNVHLELEVDALPGFSGEELASWQSNMLWSLKQYECQDKHNLVVWDIMTALLAFKQHAKVFLEHVLSHWLPQVLNCSLDAYMKTQLSDLCGSLSNVSSRQLHLLNVFCRRVMLNRYPQHKLSTEESITLPTTDENEELAWIKLLQSSEKELRERLVGFSFAAFSYSICPSVRNSQEIGRWSPHGIGQMIQWVKLGRDQVRDQLHLLASEVGKLRTRHQNVPNTEAEECCYCSAPVPFKSPEIAFCQGAKCNRTASQGHKMSRCAVSMQVCPATPTWYCICCHRWISNLAPYQFYAMDSFPQDFVSLVNSLGGKLLLKPFCPFCGILLQRKQPGFLLSVTPV